MAKYAHKTPPVEAITFDELVAFGKANGGNIVNGMPWSFTYQGHPVTHENDECYLIGQGLRLTPADMLVSGPGEIGVMPKDVFDEHYQPVREATGPVITSVEWQRDPFFQAIFRGKREDGSAFEHGTRDMVNAIATMAGALNKMGRAT